MVDDEYYRECRPAHASATLHLMLGHPMAVLLDPPCWDDAEFDDLNPLYCEWLDLIAGLGYRYVPDPEHNVAHFYPLG